MRAQIDLARAEFAVEQRRLERAAENANAIRAAQMADLGRQAQALADLKNAHQTLQQDFARLKSELAARETSLTEAQAEIGALSVGLHDSDADNLRLRDAQAELRRALASLQATADDRAAVIRERDMRLNDHAERYVAAQAVITEHAQALAQAHSVIAAAKENNAQLERHIAALEDRLAGAKRAREQDQARHDRMSETLAELERRHDDLRARAEQHKRERDALETANATHLAAQAQLQSQLDHARASLRETERAAADRIEHLRLEAAALQGALQAARARNGAFAGEEAHEQSVLAEELAIDAPAPSQELEALRAAVTDVGAKIIELREPQT
jgi:chromosome segregation ATPase